MYEAATPTEHRDRTHCHLASTSGVPGNQDSGKCFDI